MIYGTCKLYKQLPKDVASTSSAAANLEPTADTNCFTSWLELSKPCRPNIAAAKSRMEICSVQSVNFSARAPINGSTYFKINNKSY